MRGFSSSSFGIPEEPSSESIPNLAITGSSDPMKNGVLAVQTIRNNIMASTLLATTAITLSSIISVFVSNKSSYTHSELLFGNKTPMMSSIKFFTILLCFLVAFLCNVQSIRYYAHVSFLATVPTFKDRSDSIEYVARNLNRGSMFWSLGLRAFYLSFPLFLDIWAHTHVCRLLCNVDRPVLLGYHHKFYQGSPLSIHKREKNGN